MLGEPVSHAAGVGPREVLAGDLNGDGLIDAVVLNRISNTVSVYLNFGAGKLADAVAYAVNAEPYDAVVADLDGAGGFADRGRLIYGWGFLFTRFDDGPLDFTSYSSSSLNSSALTHLGSGLKAG
ncbi:MAG: FG-GAP repeat domain-containing protein [Verrucomicrobiota bacterium]